MSRRYRLFTNPRLFSFFTEKRMNFAEVAGMFFIYSILFSFLVLYFDGKQDRAREATLEAMVAEARAEVQHLKAEAAKRKGTAQSRPASLKVSSETETQTLAVQVPDDSDVSTSDDTVEVVHTGPLKGLPVDLAKEIHKEYTAASIARAKRYDEWYQRWQAHRERDAALVKKELAHGDAVLADSKKSRENGLASFALMSPEQLEAVRKEALKTQPAEEVDRLFAKVKAYSTAKTPEEINQAVQDFKKTRETLLIKRQELAAEREQLTREWEELQRTEPLPPNLGLDEFYTEWKNVIAQSSRDSECH